MYNEFPLIIHDGRKVEILELLGAGGSKTVLDVIISGARSALAIPNTVDGRETRDIKWQNALIEPENAQFLRNIGLLVNPRYDIERLSVDGEIIDAICMEPFSSLPYDIYDGKNGFKTFEAGPLSHIENYKDLLPAISGAADDIKTLVQHRVDLPSDSVSFAFMSGGSMRLFLFDLDGMEISKDTEGMVGFYSRLVVIKIDNVLDFSQNQRFDKQGYRFQERRKLAAELAEIIGKL